MFPRRAPRRRRYSYGRRRTARRLLLVAAAAVAPVLLIGYALTIARGGAPVGADAADVTGAGLQGGYGHSARGGGVTGGGGGGGDEGGWRRGGYTMMPGPAGGPAGVPALKESGAATGSVTTAASENWAGYAAGGNAGSFTRVSAAWAEPAVTCGAADTFSSFWVGLDGDGTSTVEQTGTEADCANGAASYQGWFEMFPAAPVFFSQAVRPGDAMSASVVADGGGSFTLTLEDATGGWTETTRQTSDAAQLGSAEIIAEAPSSGAGSVLPLSDFGSVTFNDAAINGEPIGQLDTAEVTLESAADVAEATPSALTDGDAFTVTFDNSGSTTGGGGGGSGGGGSGSGSGGGHRHRHHGVSLVS